MHGAQDDPGRDADHSRARHEAHGVGDETGRIAVVKAIAVDELARLVEEPVGDVMAGEGASVGTHAKVADTLAPAADVGAGNRGKSSWIWLAWDGGWCRRHVGRLWKLLIRCCCVIGKRLRICLEEHSLRPAIRVGGDLEIFMWAM